MNIIIAGNGKIGATLARQLSAEGYDITIIDTDPQGNATSGFGIDKNLMFNMGSHLLEDMAIILGLEDKAIKNTQFDAEGRAFDEKTEKYMLSLYDFFNENGNAGEKYFFRKKSMHTEADSDREYTFIFPHRNYIKFELMDEIYISGKNIPEFETLENDRKYCTFQKQWERRYFVAQYSIAAEYLQPRYSSQLL